MTTQLLYSGSDFMKDLGWLTTIIVSLAGALMVLYAVYIGFLFATASDANRRKAARERLIKVMASAFIIIALAALLGAINVRFNTIKDDVGNEENTIDNESEFKKFTDRENDGWAYSEKVTVELNTGGSGFNSTVRGEFTLSTEQLTYKGVSVDNYLFNFCRIIGPIETEDVNDPYQDCELLGKGKEKGKQVKCYIDIICRDTEEPYMHCYEDSDGKYIIAQVNFYPKDNKPNDTTIAIKVYVEVAKNCEIEFRRGS
ncbi:MAG: hypothetical protein J5598_03585 [Clostridia bacterium]|nr:hypothetical protein [Clostridia bacterium]